MRTGGASFGGGAGAVGAIRNITRAIAVAPTGNRTIRFRRPAVDYGRIPLPSRQCIRPPVSISSSRISLRISGCITTGDLCTSISASAISCSSITVVTTANKTSSTYCTKGTSSGCTVRSVIAQTSVPTMTITPISAGIISPTTIIPTASFVA